MNIAEHAHVLAAMLCIATFVAVSATMQHPMYLDDGLRHVIMARHLAEHDLVTAPWSTFMYEGMAMQLDIDPWFLFHLIIRPISTLSLNAATDIINIVTFIALLATFGICMRRFELSTQAKAILILLLVLGEPSYSSRLFLARPLLLMTPLILLVTYATYAKRPWIIGICLAVAMLLSQLFVFVACMVAWGLLWTLLIERDRQQAMHMAAASIIGGIGALILHPDPVAYIEYVHTVFLKIPALDLANQASEMQSGAVRTLPLAEMYLVLSAVAITIVNRQKNLMKTPEGRRVILLAVPVFILYAALLKWMRIIDLLWPLASLLLATIVSCHKRIIDDVIAIFLSPRTYAISVAAALLLPFVWWWQPKTVDYTWIPFFLLLLHAFVPDIAQASKKRVRHNMLGILLAMLLVMNGSYLFLTTIVADKDRDLAQYSIPDEVPPGSRILNTDWSKFPTYVAMRPDLLYANGIDSSFLHMTNRELYIHMLQLNDRKLQSGRIALDGDAWVREMLRLTDADYVVINEPLHGFLSGALRNATHADEVPTDSSVIDVFALNGEK